jgi:hypothetical protein
METIPEKCGVSIAASAIVVPLHAAESSSHFGHFARRDGGWSAQSSSLWASIHLLKDHLQPWVEYEGRRYHRACSWPARAR